VVFAVDYEVEAEDENDAMEKATEMFESQIQDQATSGDSMIDLFGVNAESD